MLSSLPCLIAAAAMTTTSAIPFDALDGANMERFIGSVQAHGGEFTDHEKTHPQKKSLQQNVSTHVQYSIRNGETPCKGVNLGSWLVAEKWMTNSADFWTGTPYAYKGEYTAIAEADDPDLIRSYFKRHHATFITKKDIAEIAAAGMNTVRVPIGYWIVGFDHNDPTGRADWRVYTKGSLKYLDKLITDWAKMYNVAVLLDIHAAKGSQNGRDHSSPIVEGIDFWASDPANVNNTITAVSFLADRYKDEEAFLGIGLLNEPNGTTTTDVLYDYYERAYKEVRAKNCDCVLTVAPLLTQQEPEVLTKFMRAPAYENVWVEWHPYFVWGHDEESDKDLVDISVKINFQDKVTKWNSIPGHNRLFFGEWSFATNNKFKKNPELFYEFAQEQIKVINQAEGGWTYWSWRIYGDETSNDMWSLRAVLRDEKLRAILFPSSSDNFSLFAENQMQRL